MWLALEKAQGTDGRDAVWNHPDLLPDTDDLDDVDEFVQRRTDGDAPLDLSSLDDQE
jgi:uncharacterized protein (DUF2342 family)